MSQILNNISHLLEIDNIKITTFQDNQYHKCDLGTNIQN